MRGTIIIIFILVLAFTGFCQLKEANASGNAFVTIFANFHQGITGTTDEAAFELVRGYIGYEYTVNEEFYARLLERKKHHWFVN